MRRLPSPSLVILVGPSGSGKSTWAATHFADDQIVSSDRLRALVGEAPHDVSASADAFALVELAVAARARRRLTTVIDTLGFDEARRRTWRELARRHQMHAVVVSFTVPARECRERNRRRADPVPVSVLDDQLRRWPEIRSVLDGEGFDVVMEADPVHVVAPAFLPTASTSASSAPAPRTAHRRLTFGLQLPSFTWPGSPGSTAAMLAAIAERAEAAGFASLWVMDHFRQIPLHGPPWHDMLESWTTLGYLAALTTRVRLGALVSGITYRNIAHLGKIVATLDVLSQGRAYCGIGLAWYREEHEAYGYELGTRAQRYALLEDALQLLPLLWGPGAPRFEGKAVIVPEAMCYPRPLQERVPILVGGSGERRTLALVARYGDACNLFGEADVIRHKVAVLHDHCATWGRDPRQIEVTQLASALVASDRHELASTIERLRPRRVGAERYARSVNAATPDDHVVRFGALHAAGVDSAIVSLPDIAEAGSIERFAAVIDAFRQ